MEAKEYPLSARRAFPSGLQATLALIRQRDSERIVMLRHLHGPTPLLLRHYADHCWVYPTKDGMVVGALAPNWEVRHPPSSNDHVSNLLSDFLHFCEQFVYRARALQITAGAALTFHVPLEFRYGGFSRTHVPDLARGWLREGQVQSFHYDPARQAVTGRRQREFAAWASGLNTLDPIIHRAAFQYWRAVNLADKQFWEEAMTALDGMTAVAGEAIQKWMRLPSAPRRPHVGLHLGLDELDQAKLEELYEMRCAFGAHPAPAKWWDFAELYDQGLDDMFELNKRLLARLCYLEQHSRMVEPEPTSWSNWLEMHAHELIDTVWFTRVR